MYLLYKRTLYNFIFSGLSNPGFLQPACNIIWLRGKDKWRVSYCCLWSWCLDVLMSWCLAVLKYSSIAAKCLDFLLHCSWYRAKSVSSPFYMLLYFAILYVWYIYDKQHQYFILVATLATASEIKLQSVNHLFTCNDYIHSRAACLFPSPTTSTTSIASTLSHLPKQLPLS